jgi:hypothetical protein
MSCGCDTRIIQITGGGAGGGPFVVQPNVPAAGQVTVTDTASGNSFVINVTGLIDFSLLTPAQQTALCAAIIANCNVATALNLNGNVIELLDGQGDILDSVDLSLLLGQNIYTVDGTLTGNRVVTQNGNDLTFLTGGGDFIIDGKLTVTGIIDPTGLQFTGGVQADAGMPNGTIYVTDGSASGFPSGEIIFKDFTGNYHQLENQPSGLNYATADLIADANHAHTWATFNQTENFTSGTARREYLTAGVRRFRADESQGGAAYVSLDLVTNNSSRLFTDVNEAGALFSDSNGANYFRARQGSLSMDFNAVSDLKINNVPGTAGQVLTSQGANLPPVWAAGAGSNYANADLTATGLRVHTWGANSQTENFTTGIQTRNYNNGPINTSITENSASSLTVVSSATGQSRISADTGMAFIARSTPLGGQANVGVDGDSIFFDFGTGRDFKVDGAAGAAGQVLTSQGAGLAPIWAAGGGGSNIYNANGTLTGNRTVDMNSFSITFQNGGDFIIDGKLTVTGIIDPTGLQFTGGAQADAGMPNGTIFVTDGSASGFPSGEIIFKDFAGNYHQLENSAGGSNYATADLTATGARVHTWAANNQAENFTTGIQTRTYVGVSTLTVTEQSSLFRANVTSGAAGSRIDVTPTAAFLLSSPGAGSTQIAAIAADGVSLSIPTGRDLSVNGNAGTVGQVLTSQGDNNPPVWGTPLPGGFVEFTAAAPFATTNIGGLISVPATTEWSNIFSSGIALPNVGLPAPTNYNGGGTYITVGTGNGTINLAKGTYNVKGVVILGQTAADMDVGILLTENVNQLAKAAGRVRAGELATFTVDTVVTVPGPLSASVRMRIGAFAGAAQISLKHMRLEAVRIGE